MDFTLKTYNKLLTAMSSQGFLFLTFKDFISHGSGKQLVLRHDVDSLPENSLQFAKMQADKGIKGTYYFRSVTENWNEEIIKKITDMGHEVGYHYEDLSFAWAKLKAQGFHLRSSSYGGQAGHRAIRSKKYEVGSKEHEDFERQVVDIAIESFAKNLEKLRKIAPVKTICMHGSPMSKCDNRLLWKYYDYHDFGIIGEPYFDVDFDEVMYITDTGRKWDGEAVSVRDKGLGIRDEGLDWDFYKDWKVKPLAFRQKKSTLESPVPSPQSLVLFPRFHSTSDIIKAAEKRKLPDKIMMTFHPQRWIDKPVPWVKELVWQNVKNVGKYFLIKVRSE